jgi:hypothetical protein
MKLGFIKWNAVRDEGGQALTEFVIVIPIVLLFFFAMLQHVADFEASQLGNYAAFMSARVYAVNYSVDSAGAQQKAMRAACWALAPVAGPAPGEVNKVLGGLFFGGSSATQSILSSIMDFTGFAGWRGSLVPQLAGNLAVGYTFAEYFRFGILGGKVQNSPPQGSPARIDTLIYYPQPVFIPGLAEMWDFVAGNKIYYSLKNLRAGLGGIPAAILPGMEAYNQAQQEVQLLDQYNANIPLLPELSEIITPYINIQSRCSIGYEPWQMYSGGPRLAPSSNSDDTDNTGTSDVGNQKQQTLQQASQDEQAYKTAAQNAKQACQNMCSAISNYNSAQSRDLPIIQNPQSTTTEVNSANTDLQSYETAKDNAVSANASAQASLSSAQQALQNDTGQSLPSVSCNCQ